MDQKTSILINRQVPEYVREEYPLFLSFIEAYYEFLENKQGTKNNDLTTKLKALQHITDVDSSIDEFEIQFLNTFVSLLPIETSVSKDFLLKNVLPLYQSKGSENSFKFLFRLLFSEEPQLKYPRDNILKASGGIWKLESTLKVSTNDIVSFYVADEETLEYKLISPNVFQVYLNGVLQTSGFKILKEYNLLEFDSPINNNDTIEVFYLSVDKNLFANRKFTGLNSGSTVITEKVFSTIINNEEVFEIYGDSRTLDGEFEIGESIVTDVIVDNFFIDVKLKTLSKIQDIIITNSGSNYNVGDPVLVVSPGAERQPRAVVSKISTSSFETINILEGGSGFQVGANVTIDGFTLPVIDIEVSSVFLDSPNTSNTFKVFTDVVSDIDPANTTINSVDYGLSGFLSGNINAVISHCFSNTEFTNLGEIVGIQINAVEVIFASTPELQVEPASINIQNTGYTTSNTKIFIDSYGSLGKILIVDAGQNYVEGDELVFVNPPGQFGLGAEAEVVQVGANGEIILVELVPPKITGTANTFTSNTRVIGTGTFFQSELRVGDIIWINGEDKKVLSIDTNTSMNVDSSFSSSTNLKRIRLYGKNTVGGAGYEQDYLPTVTVSSNAGVGANIFVVSIMGDGDNLQPVSANIKPGAIEIISVLDAGKSLVSLPEIDLTKSGDGLATAETSLIPSFEVLEGKWLNSTGLISDRNMKLQGLDYYLDYSYVLVSNIQFKKYKNFLKELLHPSGSKTYAEMIRLNVITTPQPNVVSELLQEPV
jgi:hypothetical protein